MLSPTSSRSVIRADVDAAILYGGAMGSEEDWKSYSKQLTILNMGVVEYPGPLDYLKIDTYPAVVEALEHLLTTNRNRIVHVLCGFEKWDGDPRYRGYTDLMKKAGKAPEYLEIDSNIPHKKAARKNVCEYIKANGCPDAFFCAEDEIAIGVYKGIIDMGFKIPEDAAIIGFNGIEETEYFDPSISTITQPFDEICTQAWDLLSKRMKKLDLPRQEKTVKAKFLSRRASQGK